MTRSVELIHHRFRSNNQRPGVMRMRRSGISTASRRSGRGDSAAGDAALGENSLAAPRSVNIAALIGLLLATWMNWSWPWGVLFVYWAIPAIRSGEAHLIGPVPRDEQPVLFWAITVLWILLGAMTVMVDLAPGTLDGHFIRILGLR